MKLVKRIIIYSLLLVFSVFLLSSCKPRHYYHSEEYLMRDLDHMAIVYMPKNRKDGDFRILKELSDEETRSAINRISRIEFVTPIGEPMDVQNYSFALYKTDGTVIVISWCAYAYYEVGKNDWFTPYREITGWCEKEMFFELIEEFGVDIII